MNYGSSGPQLRFGGTYVAAGQFGAWKPIGAEQTAGGYQVAWQNGIADQYVVWNTDSGGNFLSQSAVVSGSSQTVRSLESGFNQDLNGNGVIGSVTSMTSSSESADQVGPVTSGTLALLTNYMASAFVPPAGQSAGAVAATPSSDQDFLAKPAA
jgi:serralysin